MPLCTNTTGLGLLGSRISVLVYYNGDTLIKGTDLLFLVRLKMSETTIVW